RRQDRATRIRDRLGLWSDGGAGPGGGVGDGAALRRPASIVRADARCSRAAGGPSAPGVGDRVWLGGWPSAGAFSNRSGGAEPAVGGRRGARAVVRDR